MTPLLPVFCEALPSERRAEADDPTTAQTLDDAFAAARAAHPGVGLDPELFARHLARCAAGAGGGLIAALARLPAADLYLALACSAADGNALRSFEAGALREVDATAARLRLSSAIADEGKQVVRTILLMASDRRPPAIADYTGRGDLRGWIRVVATRELLRIAKKARREVTLEEVVLDAALPAVDPELDRLKQAYRAELAAALHEAIAALPRADRMLIRLALIDGLSIDEIGALQGVHRATAARRLTRAREELGQAVRDRLATRLEIDQGDVPSVLRLVQSRLDLSLEQYLAATGSVAADPDGDPPE